MQRKNIIHCETGMHDATNIKAMQYVNYADSDFYPLLHFLNKSMDYDFFNASLLHEKLYLDPDWQPGQALVAKDDQGEIAGFMLGVVRDVRGVRYGYIKLMAVAKSVTRQGIARKLYTMLERLFVERQVNVVRFGDVPMNYFMPGIDPRYTPAVCFAQRMGFTKFDDTCNLTVNLQEHFWDTAQKEKQLMQEGIEVKRAEKSEYNEVKAFVEKEWALWVYEMEMAFKDDPASLHIAKLNGEVKAFSAHNANNKGTAWFGPMGTHPDMRGKGIGGLLLLRCLDDMKARGHAQSIIPWVGPIDFYAHYANAIIDRIFWRFEKNL